MDKPLDNIGNVIKSIDQILANKQCSTEAMEILQFFKSVFELVNALFGNKINSISKVIHTVCSDTSQYTVHSHNESLARRECLSQWLQSATEPYVRQEINSSLTPIECIFSLLTGKLTAQAVEKVTSKMLT